MTLLIIYRILKMRLSFLEALGAMEGLKVYLSISAILIESAAMYSIMGIVFIALYAKNSTAYNPALAILDHIVVRSHPLQKEKKKDLK